MTDEKDIVYNEENFDSYSGTEQNAYITMFDETFHIGKLERINVVTQQVQKPIFTLGRKNARGTAAGIKVTGGSLAFAVIKESAINELKEKFEKLNEDSSYKGLEHLPPFDITIVAVKENDSEQVATKKISNVKINSKGSGIGLDSITVGESYNFSAQRITPFLKKSGKTKINSSNAFQVRG